MTTPTTFDVAVIGAGPAGATAASRLAQLGHEVVVLDRGRPRSHRLETLAPVTLDLLQLTGADQGVRDARFRPLDSMIVEWDTPRHGRAMPPGSLLVDRDRFDALLVECAAGCGAHVLAPVSVTGHMHAGSGWTLACDDASVRARFLVDATGRRTTLRRTRPPGLLAVTGLWAGSALHQPAVVAVDEGWVWAAPSGEVTAFVDPGTWRTLDGDAATRHSRLVATAMVVPGTARLVGGVAARDASSELADAVCGEDWLAVGDAALALDPLSSSGVQRSIQTALTAAVVIHTVLTDPSNARIALDHYRDMLARAAVHHDEWTGESYAAVAAVRPTPFWTSRARPSRSVHHTSPSLEASRAALVRRSPTLRFVEVSQVVGNTVRRAAAVEHPGLEGAVAYVGGTAIVPLLAELERPIEIDDLVARWTAHMPTQPAARLAAWLLGAGVLEEVGRDE